MTVDVPVHSKRERNTRNGFANIRGNWMKAALSSQARPAGRGNDASRLVHRIHPRHRRHAGPGELVALSGADATAEDTVAFNRAQVPAHAQTWKDLERYRQLFPRRLVVKGVMHPADAIRAAEIGCDGVIVSNHGGSPSSTRRRPRSTYCRRSRRRSGTAWW